jgi:hypothetical protein
MSMATRTNTQSPAPHVADSHDLIRVQGARENNLKDVSVEIPKRQLMVFTGVSGSGKSVHAPRSASPCSPEAGPRSRARRIVSLSSRTLATRTLAAPLSESSPPGSPPSSLGHDYVDLTDPVERQLHDHLRARRKNE